jgi:hypothetical protein
MERKKIIVLLGLSIVLLAFITYALGEGVRITSPSSNSNFTSLSSTLFNVSFLNGTDITDPLNATFYLNISGAWTIIGSTPASGGCQVGQTASSCAVSLTNSTIPEGVYSLNATIYNPTSSISVTEIANLSSQIAIDPSPPIVFAGNISSPATGGNYSQNVALSVSVVDLTVGVGTVFFNITNSSGQQNATVAASRSGSVFTATVNASHYLEGYVNITVYANDTLGNLNNSARVYQLIFDNTLPSITHSCDDYTVEEDDEITCSCTGSDTPSGLDPSHGTNGISFTLHPSTANTGTNFETTCTVRDRSQNLKTSTLRYNVTGGTTSGGSSAGSSSGSSSSGTTTGGSSSINNTNSTSQNNSLIGGPPNELQPNQQGEEGESKAKINYWVLAIIVVVIGLVAGAVVFLRKKNLI